MPVRTLFKTSAVPTLNLPNMPKQPYSALQERYLQKSKVEEEMEMKQEINRLCAEVTEPSTLDVSSSIDHSCTDRIGESHLDLSSTIDRSFADRVADNREQPEDNIQVKYDKLFKIHCKQQEDIKTMKKKKALQL